MNVNASTSSVTKGETLLDTVKNLEAMRADVLVLRHPASGAARFLADRCRASIVNAGDGTHEHPTQALLDAFTIRKTKGRIQGLSVVICGDVLNSARRALQRAILLGRLGAEVRASAVRAR